MLFRSGRGGGSLEDLWAFNCEEVVRAVAASELPVISAVGHQTDFTLCDLAADASAATPSMAAELAVPDSAIMREGLLASQRRMGLLIGRGLDDRRIYLDERFSSLELNSPKNRLMRIGAELDKRSEKLGLLMNSRLREAQMTLAKGASTLDALSPLAVLARGYGFVQNGEGKTLSSVEEMSVGESIQITMKDGSARAEITSTLKG